MTDLYHSANHLHLFQGQIQRFLHFCAHSKIHDQCVLLKLLVRSRECGVKALFKSEPKVNPQFALDMPIYNKITAISPFSPTVIHASYLHSSPDFYFEENPEIQLHFDGTVTASTPSGLPVHTLTDTGCHKHYLVRNSMIRIRNTFKIFLKFHFWKNIP